MATILDMVQYRLPDEADLFSSSLSALIEENKALAGFEDVLETELTVLQKSLIADKAAQALILPAMSHYKKSLSKAEGEGAGTAEFSDKLKFLQEMQKKLAADIEEKRSNLSAVTDTGVPLTVVQSD